MRHTGFSDGNAVQGRESAVARMSVRSAVTVVGCASVLVWAGLIWVMA